ncbi:MAG: S8 family serine peptidase, partial [Candidatus Eisenbacteria bacterium]|nr:S8 family serine peptidase [Candidatus Eisenbacteria bacterium]
YPWPIASCSSLGPTGCNVPPDRKIKPEVVAPGVDVYSSVPGGGYQQWGWSGTSMAGPHVAGVAALMRQANPDLDVDTVKEIIMSTAVDLGPAGEENTYGWGMIDAYEAVLAAMTGFGRLEGTVTNVSNGGTPAPGVTIEIVETERTTLSGAGGAYALSLAPGLYTVRATHPSFAPATYYNVSIAADETTVRHFSLTDIGAPLITGTTDLDSTSDTAGPYWVETTVVDEFSMIAYARLHYRVNGGDFRRLPLTPLTGGRYAGAIPGQPYTTLIEYYVEAADIADNVAVDPAAAPAELYDFHVAPGVVSLDEDVESGSPGWTHASATPGYGDQWHVSTQRNRTPGGSRSWKCGSTGSGAYAHLLDAALVTPSFEIVQDQKLSFWHWIAAQTSPTYPGYAFDGGIVEISIDGGPWQQIAPEEGYDHVIARATTPPGPFPDGTPCLSGSHGWQKLNFDLGAFGGSARLRFRFGTDASGAMEGWYIDDILVHGFVVDFSAAPEQRAPGALRLHPADPNPFLGATRLRYDLAAPGEVRLTLFDPAGRMVRALVSGRQQPGAHEARWDGRDDEARPVAPGVYLYRLQSGGAAVSGKVVLTR